jgi:hypothetical protein
VTITQEADFCIDLHCHTTASDGALPPKELVARAHARGVTHLAITDHDTIAGLEEASEAAREAGLTLIAGTELSCLWKSHTIHVVGLDFDVDDDRLKQALERQNTNRWSRARTITDKLSKLKIENLLEKATDKAGGDVPGRPHFARVLVEEGAEASGEAAEYLCEPDPESLLIELLPKHISVQIYNAFLQNETSEHAARMAAMDNASKNCNDLIDSLTLVYNKARQAAITAELMDIVGGAEALKG